MIYLAPSEEKYDTHYCRKNIFHQMIFLKKRLPPSPNQTLFKLLDFKCIRSKEYQECDKINNTNTKKI